MTALASGPEQDAFDYSLFDEEHVANAKSVAERVRSNFRALERQTLEALTKIGADLFAIKRAVGHGHFMDWVASECRMSQSQANRAMKLAEVFGADEIRHVANLPCKIAYQLASPYAKPVRDEFLKLAKAGDPLDATEIQARLSKARSSRSGPRQIAVADRQSHPADTTSSSEVGRQEIESQVRSVAFLIVAKLDSAERSQLQGVLVPPRSHLAAELLGTAIIEELGRAGCARYES